MQNENRLDRIGRAIRVPVIWGLLASGPIAVISYGFAIAAFVGTLPGWLGAVVVIAQIAALAAVGFLFDIQQERRQSSAHAQRGQPLRK